MIHTSSGSGALVDGGTFGDGGYLSKELGNSGAAINPTMLQNSRRDDRAKGEIDKAEIALRNIISAYFFFSPLLAKGHFFFCPLR